MSDFSTRFYTINQVHKGWPIFPLLHCSCFLLTNLAILHWHWSMHWSLPNWTIATRSLQVLLATCKTGCRLQSVLNAAARLVCSRRASEHTTSLLRWPSPATRTPERIQFRLRVPAYHCIHGTAPAYLADSLRPTAECRRPSPSTVCRHNDAAGAADSAGNLRRPRVSGGCGASMEQSATTD